MDKYKSLNEEVLDDEKHPELFERAKKLQDDLMEILHKFKRLAKIKGVRYDINGRNKKSDEKLEGISKMGSDQRSLESIGTISAKRRETGISIREE